MPTVTLHGPAGLSLLVTQGGRAPGIYSNAAPAYLGGVPDQTIENNTEEGLLDLRPYFSDHAGGTWEIVTTPGTGGITIGPTTGILVYDSWPLPEGSWSVVATVTNDAGAASTGAFTITVTPVSAPPGTVQNAPLTYNGGLPASLAPADLPFDWSQFISGPGPVTYGATGLPSGVSINATTGAITGTWTGTASATLTAGNGTAPDVSAGVTFSA